jgi:hypothetical protein
LRLEGLVDRRVGWEAKPVRLHQIAALPGLQYRGWAMPLK